jgi:hypothetical protein
MLFFSLPYASLNFTYTNQMVGYMGGGNGLDFIIQVGLVSLNLGICPHLMKLEIEAAQMTALDLRGCGVLSQASICCPRLLSLDASYCRYHLTRFSISESLKEA